MEINLNRITKEVVRRVRHEIRSRAVKTSNELRSAALNVLSNEIPRHGLMHRRPGGGLYRASAPGEPPALRTGALRGSWRPRTTGNGGEETIASIYTNVKYAKWLQDGTKRMAPRPYKQPIIDKAMPKIEEIFSKPFLR